MLYIQDDKTHTVREYYTSPKVEAAIEILLKQDEELLYSETLEGFAVSFVDINEEKEHLTF